MDSIEESQESHNVTSESVTSLQPILMLSNGLTTKEQMKLCCKPTYQPRRVKNKGAILVIAWSYLITNICYFGLVSEGYTGLLFKLEMVYSSWSNTPHSWMAI